MKVGCTAPGCRSPPVEEAEEPAGKCLRGGLRRGSQAGRAGQVVAQHSPLRHVQWVQWGHLRLYTRLARQMPSM